MEKGRQQQQKQKQKNKNKKKKTCGFNLDVSRPQGEKPASHKQVTTKIGRL